MDKEIIRLYKSGISTNKIAKRLDMNSVTVWRIVDKKGITRKRWLDRSGNRYGMLVVLKEKEYRPGKRTLFWKCLCDCGNTVWIRSGNFSRKRGNGGTKSCGCNTKSMGVSNIKHGLADSQFYKAYYSAKGRCTLPKNASYHQYGGKGIKFLFRNFEEFRTTMHEKYVKHVTTNGKKNTTLDRINSSGDYEPFNCRWATWSQQNRNKLPATN